MSRHTPQPGEGKAEAKAPSKDVTDVLASEREASVAVALRLEERQLVRKLDRRIMPMLAVMNLFACRFCSCLRPYIHSRLHCSNKP